MSVKAAAWRAVCELAGLGDRAAIGVAYEAVRLAWNAAVLADAMTPAVEVWVVPSRCARVWTFGTNAGVVVVQ